MEEVGFYSNGPLSDTFTVIKYIAFKISYKIVALFTENYPSQHLGVVIVDPLFMYFLNIFASF